MNPRLVESRKARAAAPETGSRGSLSRRSLALVSVLLGTPLPRMTSKPPRKVGAPPVVDAPREGQLRVDLSRSQTTRQLAAHGTFRNCCLPRAAAVCEKI